MIHIWHEDSTNSSTQQFWKFLQGNQINPLLKNAEIKGVIHYETKNILYRA